MHLTGLTLSCYLKLAEFNLIKCSHGRNPSCDVTSQPEGSSNRSPDTAQLLRGLREGTIHAPNGSQAKAGSLRKVSGHSFYRCGLHLEKLISDRLFQLFKQDRHVLVPFLLLSAALTMPRLLPNTLTLISYITPKPEIPTEDKT